MAEETKTYVFNPENGNNVPAWMAMGNNGLFGNNGWGGGILGFLLGLFFGNGWGGFGGFGNGFGNNGGAGFLSNQLNNDSGRELLMNAINSNGEASRAAISNLSTMLGQDYSQVSSAINTLRESLSSLAMSQAVSVPQIINSIQSGNSQLAAQLAQCCCENRLLTTTQGYEAQIRTLEQTNQLGSQADRNTNGIIAAINAQTVAMNDKFCEVKERELQDKIDALNANNTALRNQIDNANQTAQFAAMIAPLQAQINLIASRQPSTVPVIWPQLTVSESPTTTTAGN